MPIKAKIEQVAKKPVELLTDKSSLNAGLIKLGLKQRSKPKQTVEKDQIEFSYTLPNKKSQPPQRKAVLGLLENQKFKLIEINQTAKYGNIPMTLDRYGKANERVFVYHRKDHVFLVVHSVYEKKK